MILANSLFTAHVFQSYFPSIKRLPRVVYPGINLEAYEARGDSEVVVVPSYVVLSGLFLNLLIII